MATYNSNLITTGQGTQSIPPGTTHPVHGYVTIASNTTFGTSDTIPLFYMPGPSSHIVGFAINPPALDGGDGLTLSLEDSNATPTVIVSASTTGQAGGWISTTNAANGTILDGQTYTSSNLILLKVSHTSTNTSGASALTIYFDFQIAND